MTTIVWFRRDARLDDNPALAAGVADGRVCALFVIDPILWARASPLRRGRDYPEPIVDHAMARQRAIAAYETARGSL